MDAGLIVVTVKGQVSKKALEQCAATLQDIFDETGVPFIFVPEGIELELKYDLSRLIELLEKLISEKAELAPARL